ncbi:hypothetical protein E3N88_40865 [Mikania micrantha]|uniref:Uncharacterized protein n=1 Tax=Mikania micrantha TaxID=192012 RepID=A0A5N6LR66_9ASTR|nr:hypothetical protein E3N88_40865 [Mikania micrantha]
MVQPTMTVLNQIHVLTVWIYTKNELRLEILPLSWFKQKIGYRKWGVANTKAWLRLSTEVCTTSTHGPDKKSKEEVGARRGCYQASSPGEGVAGGGRMRDDQWCRRENKPVAPGSFLCSHDRTPTHLYVCFVVARTSEMAGMISSPSPAMRSPVFAGRRICCQIVLTFRFTQDFPFCLFVQTVAFNKIQASIQQIVNCADPSFRGQIQPLWILLNSTAVWSLEIINIGKSSKNRERRRKSCAKRSSYAPGIAKRRKSKISEFPTPRGIVSTSPDRRFTLRTPSE